MYDVSNIHVWDISLVLAEWLEMIKSEMADVYEMGSMNLTVLSIRNVRE